MSISLSRCWNQAWLELVYEATVSVCFICASALLCLEYRFLKVIHHVGSLNPFYYMDLWTLRMEFDDDNPVRDSNVTWRTINSDNKTQVYALLYLIISILHSLKLSHVSRHRGFYGTSPNTVSVFVTVSAFFTLTTALTMKV